MSKFYTASSLMAFSEIKEEADEISIQINGGGISGLIYSDIKLKDNNAIIKGFMGNPKIDLENDNTKINISEIIGKSGKLIVIKNNKYTKMGYKGITHLISGNILDDLIAYFQSSTQKPAFMDLEFINENDLLKSAGYLITFMPDASEEEILKVKNNIKNCGNLEIFLRQNQSADDIVKIITGDDNIKKIQDNLNVIYHCDCNKQKYRDMLFTLKKQDLQELLSQDEKINIICDYCNKSYDFSKEELEDIINTLN